MISFILFTPRIDVTESIVSILRRLIEVIQAYGTMDALLVEESTPFKLAQSLESLARTIGENGIHHDYIMAVVIVIMAETGFYSSNSTDPTDTDERCRRKSSVIPSDWKSPRSGNYEMRFFAHPVTDRECKILAIPCGDTLVINLMLLTDSKKVYSMGVQTVKYVNVYSSDLTGRYLNLKEFSFKFKNTVATPARCEILSAARIANASLTGIPVEIKLRILAMLDARSLSRLAETCREFNELGRESEIWKILYKRDFPGACSPQSEDYREAYRRSARKNRPTISQRSSSIWRCIPHSNFYDYHSSFFDSSV